MAIETDSFFESRATEINFDHLKTLVDGEVVEVATPNGKKVEKLLVADQTGIFQWGITRETTGDSKTVFMRDQRGSLDITSSKLLVSQGKLQIVDAEIQH